MKIKASFISRSLVQSLAPPAVTFRVEQYSMHVLGGPKQARIVATGREEDLWDCINLLRCGVELHDERGDVVWWGYVDDVRVNMDSAEWGVGMDAMANSIACAYTTQEGSISTAGNRQTTAYAQDSPSIAEYGERQLVVTANNVTEAGAQAIRDQALSTIGWPMPMSDLAEGTGSKVVILCRGWYDTLGWRYFANPAGVNGYVAMPDQRQPFGDHVAKTETIWVMPAGSDTFDTIGMFYYKNPYGAPVANINGEIRLTHRTGSLLATWTITPADVAALDNGRGGYIEKALSSTITGSTAQICILLNRVGGAELVNHYHIGCVNGLSDPNSYTNTYGSDVDAWFGSQFEFIFKFTRKDNIITQLQAMLTSAGQFISGIDVEASTTITTNPYRAGDATARTQIEELLTMHTGSTGRMALEITRDRRARIYSEPDTTAPIYVDRYMNPFASSGAPLERHYCPYGYWASLKEVLPASGVGGGSDAASGAVGFVESAEYNVQSNRWVPRFRQNKSALIGGR